MPSDSLVLVCRGCDLEVGGFIKDRTSLQAHAEEHQRDYGKDHITHIIPPSEKDDFF